MRKWTLLGAAALAVMTAGPALAGSATGNGAFKEPLAPASGSMCSTPQAATGNVAGFAILNKNGTPGGTGDILGEISVKNTPGTYMAFLRSNDNMAADCMPIGTVITNNQGNGNLHYDVPMQPSAHYFIELDDSSGIRYATPEVFLD